MLITDLPSPAEVSRRRHDDAVFALDRLQTTAATSSLAAAARASASPYGTKITSPGNGTKGSRYFGLWVNANEPMERPWNAPSVEMILVRPVILVILKPPRWPPYPSW